MRITKKLFIFLFLVLFFSCKEQGLFVDFNDCLAEEPLKTNLEIKIDLNYTFATTLITVYEGNLEDSVLYISYNPSSLTNNIPVSINKKYTVTASYYIPPNHYIAVDAATPRVRYLKEKCNDPCYIVYDRIIDLTIKYKASK